MNSISELEEQELAMLLHKSIEEEDHEEDETIVIHLLRNIA